MIPTSPYITASGAFLWLFSTRLLFSFVFGWLDGGPARSHMELGLASFHVGSETLILSLGGHGIGMGVLSGYFYFFIFFIVYHRYMVFLPPRAVSP